MSFEDPLATCTALKTFHAFGQPLSLNGLDVIRLTESETLTRHSLTLGAQEGAEGSRKNSSCVYLQPMGAQELFITELYAKVEQLTGCRCGGCFDCLKKAGCIDF